MSGTSTIGVDAGSLTLSGAISGTGGLTKIGAGMLALSGSNTFSGNLTVDGGTLNMPSGYLSPSNQFIGYQGTGSFTQSGGTNTVTVGGENGLYLGSYADGSGSYNLSGSGSLNAPTEYIGVNGSGRFTQSGGTNAVSNGGLYLGYTGNGSYNLSGSGVLNAPTEYFGYEGGSGSFTQSGGTNAVSNGLYLGSGGGSYNLDGGLLLVGGGIASGSRAAAFNFGGGTLGASAPWSSSMNMTLTGDGGPSTVDTTGGNISLVGNLSGSGSLTKAGSGSLTLSGSNTYTGTTTLSSGEINLGSAETAGTSGPLGKSAAANPGSIVLNGGYLQYSAVNHNDYSGRFSTAANQAYNVDTNGQSVTWATALTSPAGSLTKIGAGVLTLTASNTYTGPTTISGGTLQIGNGGTAVTLGPRNILDNGTLMYNFSSAAIVSMTATPAISGSGNLAATAGIIQLSRDITVGGSQSYVQVGGGSLYTGIQLLASTTLTASAVTLSGDVGVIIGLSNDLAVDTSAANGPINLDISLGRVNVFYSPTSFTANAGSGPINVTGTGPASAGWRSTPVTLIGAVNITANVNSNALVTIDATADGSVSGALSGSMPLELTGTGTLTLTASNTYTGTTTISGGILQVGNGGSGASIGSTAGVVDNASLVFNHSDNVSFTPAISGIGSLAKIGAGMLTLSGSNTFSGNLTVNGGTLNMPGGYLSPTNQYIGYSGTGNFTQSGGTNAVSNSLYLGHNGGGSYNLSGSGVLNAPTEYIGYSGSGSFTQSGGTNAVGSVVIAQIVRSSGTYNLNGGLLLVGSGGITPGSGTAAFNFGGGTLGASAPWSSSMNMTLTGSGGNGTVDTTGGNIGLSGNLSGSGGLTKLGAGLLILSGTNSYSNGTIVEGGTLELLSGSALPNGTSLTVGAGGTVIFDPSYVGSPVQLTQSQGAVVGVAAVPEPGTLALLGAGALGLLGYGWRKRKLAA